MLRIKQNHPNRSFTSYLKKILATQGYQISRSSHPPMPGSSSRPIGNMETFLEDLQARGLQPKAILDVGANTGGWSRCAKKIFPQAECFLIEPQQEMQIYLESFCEEFPDCHWLMAGAGNHPGELILSVWDDFLGSSLLPPEVDEAEQVIEQRTVPIITIDSFLEQGKISIPELVKLDIQGFELEALKGASRLFGNTEVFILEVSLFRSKKDLPIFDEVVDFMRQRGYFVYDFPGFLRRPYDGALGQVDVCFVKEKSFLRQHHRWHIQHSPVSTEEDARKADEERVNKEHLTIAICTYNNASLLTETLEDIAKQTVDSAINWSVLVIDNNCTDNTAELVEFYRQSGRIPGLKIIQETKQGLSFARRRAVLEIDSDLIAFVDDDCHLAPDWVEQVFHFCQQYPQAGAVGSRVHLQWAKMPEEELIKFQGYLASYDRGNIPCQLPATGATYLVGAGLVVKKSALLASGWLDRSMLTDRQGRVLSAGGDSEMVLRIRNAGYQLWYNPAMELSHYIPQNRTSVDYFCRLLRGIGRSMPTLATLADRQPLTLAVRSRFLGYGIGYVGKMLLSIAYQRLHWRQTNSAQQQIYLHHALGYLEGAVQLLFTPDV